MPAASRPGHHATHSGCSRMCPRPETCPDEPQRRYQGGELKIDCLRELVGGRVGWLTSRYPPCRSLYRRDQCSFCDPNTAAAAGNTIAATATATASAAAGGDDDDDATCDPSMRCCSCSNCPRRCRQRRGEVLNCMMELCLAIHERSRERT